MSFANHTRARLAVSMIVLGSTFTYTCQAALAQTLFVAEAQLTVDQQFEEVIRLRADGRYDEAIDRVNAIMTANAANDAVLQVAYHHLVTTYLEMDREEAAEEVAREAVGRFWRIRADEVIFPASVNRRYDQLRAEMFGSLTITDPAECTVYLNEQPVGETPLDLDLYPIGDYELKVTRAGYNDYIEKISIEPGQPVVMVVSLKKKRDKKWWGYRIGAATIAAAGLIALGFLSSGGDDEPPPPDEPLPTTPPPPPAN